MLKVGPESAGSNPGPACYGRGGERPPIIDAFAVLGYIGQSSLDYSALSARRADGSGEMNSLTVCLRQARSGSMSGTHRHACDGCACASGHRGSGEPGFGVTGLRRAIGD